MSPEEIKLGLVLTGTGFLLFFLVVVWAFDVTLDDVLRALASTSDLGRDLMRVLDAAAPDEKPWVTRARAALGRLKPVPRRFGTLEGWSWRPVERDPNMTVRVQDRSPDGRRLEGYIIGTPGVLQVACKARTRLRLIDGWVTLAGDGDPPMTLRAGDSLVVEPGFRGSWENETVTHLNFDLTLP